MGRKYSLAQTQGWEIPASESQSDVRHYMYLTPAGVALGDLVAIVAYMFAGGLILGVVVIMGLVALLEQEFSDSWRWAVAAGLVPPALVGLLFLRLIVALVNAALERILGVDLDDSGEVGDIVLPEPVVHREHHLIPVRGPEPKVNGVPLRDFIEFVDRMCNGQGHTKRDWINYRFRSGRVCDYETWRAIVSILEQHGVIEGKSHGSAGRLTMDNSVEIIEHLQLTGAL